jgi:hypothetical protein
MSSLILTLVRKSTCFLDSYSLPDNPAAYRQVSDTDPPLSSPSFYPIPRMHFKFLAEYCNGRICLQKFYMRCCRCPFLQVRISSLNQTRLTLSREELIYSSFAFVSEIKILD